MSDGILTVGTVFDKGPLLDGVLESKEAFTAALNNMTTVAESSKKKIRESVTSISEGFRQQARDVTAESMKIGAALREQAQAAADSANVRRILRAGVLDEAEATRLLATDYERVSAAAKNVAESQEMVGAAISHTVPEVAAASGAIRVLEGNMPIRAVERFAVTTLGLGPILSKAFPIFGAVALGEIIARTAGEMGKFAQDALNLSQELSVGWLDGAILQMQGFGDKLKEIDKDIQETGAHTDAQIKEQAEMAFSRIGQTQGPASESNARMQDLVREKQGVEAMLPALRERLALEQKFQAAGGAPSALKLATSDWYDNGDMHKLHDMGVNMDAGPLQADINQTTANLKDRLATITTLNEQITKLSLQASDEGTPKAKPNPLDRVSPAESAFLSDQHQLNSKILENAIAGHSMQLQEELAFWQRKLRAATEGSELYRKIQEQVNFARKTGDSGGQIGTESPDASGANADFLSSLGEEVKAKQDAIKEEMLADRDAAEQKMRLAEDVFAETEKNANMEVRVGVMTPAQRLVAVQAAAAQELQTRLQLSGYMQMLDMGNEKSFESDLKQQAQAYVDYARQLQQLAEETALKQQQAFQKVFQDINGPLNTFVDHWLTSGQRMQQAFAKMYDQMATEAINSLLKQAEKFAMHELLLTAWHMVGVKTREQIDDTAGVKSDARLASDVLHALLKELHITSAHAAAKTTQASADAAAAGTAATVNAAQLASNSALAQSAAGLAAAQAAAEAAAAGGPVAAIAAGAATYASILPYVTMAAFDNGGVVGNSMGLSGMGAHIPILAEASERVLTPSQNSNFERLVNQSNSATNVTNHFHHNENFSGVDGASVENMYRKNAATARKEMMRQLRRSNVTM